MKVRTARLGDVCEINPRLSKVPADDTIVSFLPMASISEGGFILGEEQRRIVDVKKGYTFFERADVLLAKITPCFENGKAARTDTLVNDIGFGSTEFHVLRASDEITAAYVFYAIWDIKFRELGTRNMTGSAGQKRIPADFLRCLEIPLPSLDEQRRITEILDKADALRRKRKHALGLLDGLTQSLFLESFGDLIEKGPYRRRPISDWVADFETGKNIAPDPDAAVEDGFRVLKVSAVTSGRFEPSESKPLPAAYRPPTSHLVREGDLLFSRANTENLIGAVALVDRSPTRLALPDKIWRFRWRAGYEPHPLFIHALFSTPSFRREISKRATGTSGSMKNISKEKVLSIEVGQPSREEQDRFIERGIAVSAMRHRALSQSALAEQVFASLQHRAFTGQL